MSFRNESDIVTTSGGQALWSNQDGLEVEGPGATNLSALQVATSSFTHPRLATAFTDNANTSYLYGQLTNSLLTEGYLHISSTISMTSSNISINLS